MKLLTSCKECIFATYDGKTQIDCAAGRLKFMPAQACYDEEKEFFVTDGISCTMYRKPEWTKEFETQNECLKRARSEITFKYVVIISDDNLDEKLDLILSQKIQPSHIYIYTFNIANKDRVKDIPNSTYIQYVEQNNNPIERIIRKIKKSTNILYIDDVNDLSKNSIENLDNLVNDSGWLKAIITSDNSESFILPSILYVINPTSTHTSLIKSFCRTMPEIIGKFSDIYG